MDAWIDLPLPHPASAELVAVSALVEEDVAFAQRVRLYLLLRRSNSRYVRKIQVTALNICHSQIRNLAQFLTDLLLCVLSNAADDICK